MREVHLLNPLMHFGQHIPSLQIDDGKGGPDLRENVWFELAKQKILAV